MPATKTYRNDKGRFRTPTPAEKDVDIRQESDVGKLEGMLRNGAPTFVLIYADWCGHCHRYLPTWAQLEDTPGRTANMARVHYDMQEKIPAIKDAKIQGYPTVIKVLPDGRIQSFAAEGGATNAVPYMREESEMQADLQGKEPHPTSVTTLPSPSPTATAMTGGGATGGVLGAFTSAIQQAGPVALLLLANSVLRKTGKQRRGVTRSYRTPKRSRTRRQR